MIRSRFWALILVVLFILISTHAASAQQKARIPDGTAVKLATTAELNSATNNEDDPVGLEVTEDVKVGDTVLVHKGATAMGHITDVEKKKRLGRAGKLNFAVDYVKAPDGTNVRLRATSQRKGDDKTGTVIVGTVLLSPLFLIMRGKDVKIPKGTTFTAFVDGDRDIALGPGTTTGTMGTSVPSPAPTPLPDSAGGTVEVLATTVVNSNPDGADITVNGKYFGSTPTTLNLPAGEHTITLTKAAYKSWQKTVTITPGGTVTIKAELEKN